MLFCGSVWPPPSIAAMHGGSRSGPCPSRRRARPRLAWAFIAADLPRLSQAAALRCGAGSLPIYDCALQLSLPCAVCRGALKPLCAAALQLLFAALLAAAVCAALFAACCLGRRSSRPPSARPSSRLTVWGGPLRGLPFVRPYSRLPSVRPSSRLAVWGGAAALNGGASSPAAAAFHAPRRPGWMPSVCPFCLFRTGKWTFLFI